MGFLMFSSFPASGHPLHFFPWWLFVYFSAGPKSVRFVCDLVWPVSHWAIDWNPQMGMGQNQTKRIWTVGFSPCFHLPGIYVGTCIFEPQPHGKPHLFVVFLGRGSPILRHTLVVPSQFSRLGWIKTTGLILHGFML